MSSSEMPTPERSALTLWLRRCEDEFLRFSEGKEPSMAARLVACNIPTTDHTASNAFYQALLGIEPARSLTSQLTSYHVPVSNDGQYLWLTDRTVPEEQPTAVFVVDNLDQAITDLTAAGGQQF